MISWQRLTGSAATLIFLLSAPVGFAGEVEAESGGAPREVEEAQTVPSPLELADQQAQQGQLDDALQTLERALQAHPEAWAMHRAIQAIHLRHAARAYAEAVGLPPPPAALQLLPSNDESRPSTEP